MDNLIIKARAVINRNSYKTINGKQYPIATMVLWANTDPDTAKTEFEFQGEKTLSFGVFENKALAIDCLYIDTTTGKRYTYDEATNGWNQIGG